MALTLVAEQEEPRKASDLFTRDQPRDKPPQPTSPQVLAVLQAISMVLAIRVVLVLAGAGAFILAAAAVWIASPGAIVSAGLYDLLVMLPLVGLSLRKG